MKDLGNSGATPEEIVRLLFLCMDGALHRKVCTRAGDLNEAGIVLRDVLARAEAVGLDVSRICTWLEEKGIKIPPVANDAWGEETPKLRSAPPGPREAPKAGIPERVLESQAQEPGKEALPQFEPASNTGARGESIPRRGYYRVPKQHPANKVRGLLAEAVRRCFVEGWSKSRIAREFRLNRRTVIRLCAEGGVAAD